MNIVLQPFYSLTVTPTHGVSSGVGTKNLLVCFDVIRSSEYCDRSDKKNSSIVRGLKQYWQVFTAKCSHSITCQGRNR